MTRLPQFPDSDKPLTEEQRQFAVAVGQVRQKAQADLTKTVADMNLRKWCVDKAIEATRGGPAEMVKTAREIFEFVFEAIKDEAR